MAKLIWTKEICRELALKYTSIDQFYKNHASAYLRCRLSGWLDELTSHMTKKKKPNGYWDSRTSELLEEAKKHKYRSDLQIQNPSIWLALSRRGLIEEACKHMEPKSGRYKRQIYILFFKESNSAYCGLSVNAYDRINNHKQKSHSKLIKEKIKTEMLETRVLKKLYTPDRAKIIEQRVTDLLLKKGFNVLNSAKCGSLGGGFKKWNKENVIQELNKNIGKTNKEIWTNRPLYKAAIKLGVWNDMKHLFPKERMSWNEQLIIKTLLPYKSFFEMKKNKEARRAYYAASRLGIDYKSKLGLV